MTATRASATGTVACEHVEPLLVLLEGISGYERRAHVVHEALLETSRRQRIEYVRSAPTAAALADQPWEVRMLGEKDGSQKAATVRSVRSTRLAATPAYSAVPLINQSPTQHDVAWLFLHAYGGFVLRSQMLKVGYILALPDGASAFVFTLFIVGPDHDLEAARPVGEDWVVHVSASATMEEQARGKSLDVLLRAIATTCDAVAAYTDLQGRCS